MITSIRLVNWRSHSDTLLKFSPGTNLLIGVMGSGKSAAMDAMVFALFGTFPALERRQLKLDDVIRYNEPHAKVVLEFSWNGNGYKIEREIARKKDKISTKADIYRDGTLLETGAKAVSELVAETVGVDYDLFTRAIYSEQNNIDYFLSLDPKRRKDEFDRILGLDRFETARANAVTIANRFEAIAQTLSEKYNEKRAAELGAAIADHQAKEKRISEEAHAARAALAGAREAVGKLSAEYAILEKKRKRLEEIEREIAGLRGKIASLEEGLKKIDAAACEKAKKQLEEMRRSLQTHEKAILENTKKEKEIAKSVAVLEMKVKEQQELSEKLEKLKTALRQLLRGEDLEKMKHALAEEEKRLLEKTSERNSELKKIQETKELLKHLAAGVSNCPLCSSELGPAGVARIKEKKHAEIKHAEEQAEKLAKDIGHGEKAAAELKERIKKAEFAKERIAALEPGAVSREELAAKKKTAIEQLAAVSEAAEKQKAEKAEVQKRVETLLVQLKEMEDMRRREEAAEAAKKRLAAFEDERKQTAFNESAYMETRKRLEATRIEEEKLSQKTEYLEKEGKMIEEGKKIYERELNEMKAVRKKAEATQAMVEELKIYKNALLETQITLRKGLIDAINSAMNEIWGIFYPYGNYKSLRVEVTEKDYVFEVLENEAWKPLETVASGGERACAALTLRVALAMVLTPNLSWLILDEPTHNLDADAISLLSETLQVKVPQVVKQTFVITHEEALIGADFSTTYKLSRDKEHAGPTKIETV